MKKLCILIFSSLLALLPSLPCRAQQTQEQLAQHYYNNGDFAQAVELYESLYKQTPNNFYYQMLYRSYLAQEQYRDAERLCEQRLRKNSNDLTLHVDLGMVHQSKGEGKKATRRFDEALEHIGFDSQQTSRLAQAFETASHPEYAIQVYLTARQKMKNEYAFINELATLYRRVGEYEKMIQEYFDLLDKQPGMLSSIQVSLQRALAESSDPHLVDGLRSTLIQRIHHHPDNGTYMEMMIWFSLQQKDFRFAMAQAKAVDARFPEYHGETLMRVATIAQSNADYDVAEECYNIVAKKGNEHPHYFDSRVGQLQVRFARLNRNFPVEMRKLKQLMADYDDVLTELGKNIPTVPLMRNYAQLCAYYADSLQRAADMLYDILDLPKLPAKTRDEVKLDLGDLLLFAGEMWDASLLYMQVEKNNKQDALGAQAKFKNAKLSYYNHDFLWAKSQLDVLRASTSKLIANDAMELSLLISDNMEEDSTFDRLAQYAEADLFLYRNQLDSAWILLDAVATSALSHPLFDEVLLQKARIRIRQQQYAEADSLLQQLVDLYSTDLLADDALMLQARLNEEHLHNPDKARACYERLILDNPDSLYVEEARKKRNQIPLSQ